MKAVVTGAAGFLGYSLTMELLNRGYTVYAIVRPNSEHNVRFEGSLGDLHIIELDCSDYNQINKVIIEQCDVFFHIAWFGGRYDLDKQMDNILVTDSAVQAAAELGCQRFLCTGSQAEYGPCISVINEGKLATPIDAYGTAKLATLYLSKQRASQLGIEWIWGRIFSLYGLYEPEGRLFPELIRKMIGGEEINLSSCEQHWDYLDVRDAARAIIALGEKGDSGEIYNIVSGSCRPLKEYIEEMKKVVGSNSIIKYGNRANPFYSLQVDRKKITNDTGWEPEISFKQGVEDCLRDKIW